MKRTFVAWRTTAGETCVCDGGPDVELTYRADTKLMTLEGPLVDMQVEGVETIHLKIMEMHDV